MPRKRNVDSGTPPGETKNGASSGELRGGRAVKTALIPGRTFRAKAVQYVEIDGLAMFEGDIVLGTVADVETVTQTLRQEASGAVAAGVVIPGANRHWPNCRVPFTIDPTLPNQARVTDAIAHWESKTSYRFVARTGEADFVTFRSGGGCSSSVGRQGGQQFVNLGATCTQGNCIHEIGHTVGLWHEQSREDRDLFVTIHFNKITPGLEHNFDQHITDGDDVGAYDYGSIMHYPRDAFSIDGSDTITPVTAASIGQRVALSAGDIAAAGSLCTPITTTVKEMPQDVTLKEQIKDGRLDTRKELVKDIRLDTRKELVLDTLKEMIRDTIKEGAFDPGPATLVELPVTPGQPPLRPGGIPILLGGARPFAVATPARDAAQDCGCDTSDAGISQLDAALQSLADRLVALETDKALLQAQYHEISALLQQSLATREAGGGA